MASDPLPTETKYIVPALAQGLSILSLFSGAQRSFTAPEIAKKTVAAAHQGLPLAADVAVDGLPALRGR